MKDEDLDFTRTLAKPIPAPSLEQIESAGKEAAVGGAHLRSNGYYVAMARRAAATIPPRDGERYILLVIDDDPDLSALLVDIFGTAGFDVRTAKNRAEINAEVNKPLLPDLILLDITLPDADGLQILGRLRLHPKFARMPVILMTGKSGIADVKAGLAAGADGYVSKPFKVSALVTAVNLVLGRS